MADEEDRTDTGKQTQEGVAATVASPMSSIPDTPDALTISVMPVMPVAGVADAANPRSTHIRLIAKATPAHRGRVEALTTLMATDMDTKRTVSEPLLNRRREPMR